MPWSKTPEQIKASNRKYGRRHKTLRKQLLAKAYGTPCTRCGEVMQPGQLLHLDHDDHNPTKYRGFSHKDCNLRAAALKARTKQLYGTQSITAHRW